MSKAHFVTLTLGFLQQKAHAAGRLSKNIKKGRSDAFNTITSW